MSTRRKRLLDWGRVWGDYDKWIGRPTFLDKTWKGAIERLTESEVRRLLAASRPTVNAMYMAGPPYDMGPPGDLYVYEPGDGDEWVKVKAKPRRAKKGPRR